MSKSGPLSPKLLLFSVHFYSGGNQMTNNAACLLRDEGGNAASYKDKKSVPAFFLFDWITSGEGNPS